MLDLVAKYQHFIQSFQVHLYEQEGPFFHFKAELQLKDDSKILAITDLGVLCEASPPLEKGDLGGFKKASNYPQIPYNQDFLLWFAGFTQRTQRFFMVCVA